MTEPEDEDRPFAEARRPRGDVPQRSFYVEEEEAMLRDYTRRKMLRLSFVGTLGAVGLGDTGWYASAFASPVKAVQGDSPIKTRIFWTWDHSTEWVPHRPGAQTIGASNPYGRTEEVFVQDYTLLLEWCGRHGIDAVVVWGLLRDSHGGVEAAKRLCDVALKNGVRLLCGVGLNAYGGVYYEGSSRYSLGQHLKSHPDLYARDLSGKEMILSFGTFGPSLTHHACPSRRENQDYAAESLRWLFKSLPLGGVQMETGDTGVCRCNLCEKRRNRPVSTFSWEDMALMYPIATEGIRSVSPDAWIVCETYSHPEPYAGPREAPNFGEGKPPWADECLARFPSGVIVQWVCDRFVKPKQSVPWTQAGRVSNGRHRHIMRAHLGTYWEGNVRGELSIDWIADMVQQSIRHGFDAISLFGEVSPFESGAELNYLALQNYGSARNPKADLDVYLGDVAAILLGGEKAARDYLAFARLRENPGRIRLALKEIYAHCSTMPPDVARRWAWLGNFLASFTYNQPSV